MLNQIRCEVYSEQIESHSSLYVKYVLRQGIYADTFISYLNSIDFIRLVKMFSKIQSFAGDITNR